MHGWLSFQTPFLGMAIRITVLSKESRLSALCSRIPLGGLMSACLSLFSRKPSAISSFQVIIIVIRRLLLPLHGGHVRQWYSENGYEHFQRFWILFAFTNRLNPYLFSLFRSGHQFLLSNRRAHYDLHMLFRRLRQRLHSRVRPLDTKERYDREPDP